MVKSGASVDPHKLVQILICQWGQMCRTCSSKWTLQDFESRRAQVTPREVSIVWNSLILHARAKTVFAWRFVQLQSHVRWPSEPLGQLIDQTKCKWHWASCSSWKSIPIFLWSPLQSPHESESENKHWYINTLKEMECRRWLVVFSQAQG